MVGANLARVVGPQTPEARKRLVRRAFVDYGRYWAQVARLDPRSPKVITDRWRIDGRDHLRRELKEGRGVILALPHLGSWEVGGMWLAANGFPFTTVVEPLQPPELHAWFAEQRRRLGMKIIPLGQGIGPALLSELRAGGLVVLLADRDLTGDGIEVPFFGAPARLPAGPAVLALRTGASLLPCAVYHDPRGRYRGVILAPVDTSRSGRFSADVERVTRALASDLEGLIRAAPAQWHAFQPIWPEDQRG